MAGVGVALMGPRGRARAMVRCTAATSPLHARGTSCVNLATSFAGQLHSAGRANCAGRANSAGRANGAANAVLEQGLMRGSCVTLTIDGSAGTNNFPERRNRTGLRLDGNVALPPSPPAGAAGTTWDNAGTET
eukprot:355782-Chlamydomonas_euryale.AAC.3